MFVRSKCWGGSVSTAGSAHAGFISQDTLKGLPVKKDVSIKTIDPYFAAYIRDATCPDVGFAVILSALLKLRP